jgi:two-component sensor histidine kinase
VSAGDLSQVRSIAERAWAKARDGFSSRVLGITSQRLQPLDGGLSRAARLGITAGALALAAGVGVLAGAPWGALFFLPALMIAGLFGDGLMAALALGISVLAAWKLFAGLDLVPFAAAASLQTALALLLRAFFRESRRWGVRYRRLLGALASAVTVSDDKGRIERPHPELGRLIGMPWPAHAGLKWLASVHPEDQGKLVPSAPFKDVLVQRAEIRLKDPASGDWRWHLMQAVPLMGENGEVEEWISTLTDIHEHKLSGEQQDMVIGEARHRLKNLMTIIESLVKSSRTKGESDPAVAAFESKILGRLHALSAASDLALAGNYTTMAAREVVAATLAPFLETEGVRISFGGPDLQLSQATGGSLALGLHELATNAIKHGSLRVPEGRVSFTWTATPGGRVEMVWRESGGPAPGVPVKGGYGARVIGFIAAREQNGAVTMEYPVEGYICRISFTMAERVE